jgi:hypothetical protein
MIGAATKGTPRSFKGVRRPSGPDPLLQFPDGTSIRLSEIRPTASDVRAVRRIYSRRDEPGRYIPPRRSRCRARRARPRARRRRRGGGRGGGGSSDDGAAGTGGPDPAPPVTGRDVPAAGEVLRG